MTWKGGRCELSEETPAAYLLWSFYAIFDFKVQFLHHRRRCNRTQFYDQQSSVAARVRFLNGVISKLENCSSSRKTVQLAISDQGDRLWLQVILV